MNRRTFLKSVVAMCVMPGLPKLQARPEAIYTAKTFTYDVRGRGKVNPIFRGGLGEWDGVRIVEGEGG